MSLILFLLILVIIIAMVTRQIDLGVALVCIVAVVLLFVFFASPNTLNLR